MQGAGILEPEKVRLNAMRHAVGKLGALLPGGGSVSRDQDWMKTNRCRRCHGTGVFRSVCPDCGGSGRRVTKR